MIITLSPSTPSIFLAEKNISRWAAKLFARLNIQCHKIKYAVKLVCSVVYAMHSQSANIPRCVDKWRNHDNKYNFLCNRSTSRGQGVVDKLSTKKFWGKITKMFSYQLVWAPFRTDRNLWSLKAIKTSLVYILKANLHKPS